MRMSPRGRQNGSGAALAVGVNGLFAGFGDAPPIIAAALDAMNHFPKFPAYVADPKIALAGVETQTKGIAKTVSPNFRKSAGSVDEWIVLGHGVILAGLLTIDID